MGVTQTEGDRPAPSLDALQYVGEIAGCTGAALVALPAPLARGVGFAVWLLGNAAWITYGRRAGNRHIARLFSFYLLTAAIGLAGIVGGGR